MADHQRPSNQVEAERDVSSVSNTRASQKRQQSSLSINSSTRIEVAGLPENSCASAQDEVPKTTLSRTDTSGSAAGPVYSVFTTGQKRFIVFMASWAGFFSPVSATIYLPALNALAAELHVSDTLINLTLTSYMIFQGLAPAFIGSLTDALGRRPAYATCFVIYIAANIGLALQDSYAALFVLRCVQSTGSSATIAMASAVVADISTPAERGAFMGFTLAGSLLGPAIGPVLGGVLTEFLGWRAVFWFLTIFAAVFLAVFLVFFPETARNTVGNGSIPPKGWNMSLINYLAIRKAQNSPTVHAGHLVQEVSLQEEKKKKSKFPNPLASLAILLDKENALVLFYNGFLFAAFYDITAIIPSQFARIYHFNDFQIGLCYIPFGVGSMCAALVNGQLLDRNFARWCRKLGVPIRKGRDQNLRHFPIEKARLQIGIPAAYFACSIVLIFGWLLEIKAPLAAVLVILFIGSFSMSIAFNTTSTLLVDFYPRAAATATAANNLVRCLLGAGATGVVIPMVNGMGLGWTFTFLSLFLLVSSPMLSAIYFFGMRWRQERASIEEERQKKLDSVKSGKEEEGVVNTHSAHGSPENEEQKRDMEKMDNDRNQTGKE